MLPSCSFSPISAEDSVRIWVRSPDGMSNLWSRGVVVITSALHAEGPQFDPGRDQFCLVLGGKILGERNLESNSTCQVGRVV